MQSSRKRNGKEFSLDGLRRRPTYDEVVDYLENGQPKIKYPDRQATFLRNSPYLSQFDGDSWIDLEEQEKNITEAQMRELELKKLTSETKQTHMEMRAMGSQTDKQHQLQVFRMDYDDQMDDDSEKELEERRRKRYPIIGKQSVNPEPYEKHAESRASQIARGMGSVVKNYAYPFTRDILAPAAGEVAVNLTKGAAWLIGKSFWSVADIIWALNGGSGGAPPAPGRSDPGPAIGFDGIRSAIGGSSSSSGSSRDDDVERLSKKSKGYLVEEIYKKPGWARMFGREDSSGYTNNEIGEFRKKLGKMSNKDLAKVLITLEN